MKSCVKRTATVAMDCRKTVRSQDFGLRGKTARRPLGAHDLLVDTLPAVRQNADDEGRCDQGTNPGLTTTISPKPENKDSK